MIFIPIFFLYIYILSGKLCRLWIFNKQKFSFFFSLSHKVVVAKLLCTMMSATRLPIVPNQNCTHSTVCPHTHLPYVKNTVFACHSHQSVLYTTSVFFLGYSIFVVWNDVYFHCPILQFPFQFSFCCAVRFRSFSFSLANTNSRSDRFSSSMPRCVFLSLSHTHTLSIPVSHRLTFAHADPCIFDIYTQLTIGSVCPGCNSLCEIIHGAQLSTTDPQLQYHLKISTIIISNTLSHRYVWRCSVMTLCLHPYTFFP